MKRILSLFALSSAAVAQQDVGETFQITVSNDLSPATPTATVAVWAKFDPADYAFATAHWDMFASEPGWGGAKLLLKGPATNPGMLNPTGNAYLGIREGQLHFPCCAGIFANTSNPIAIWMAEFSTTDFTPRSIDIWSVTALFDVYIDPAGNSASRLATFTEGSGHITVVPAPGGAWALAGLAICVASRRGRRA